MSSESKNLTHIDESGDVRMVDVSDKDVTEREAIAEGRIYMNESTLDLIESGDAKKGDVEACARVAGVMAAKKTSDIIPMCHPIEITKVSVKLEHFREDDKCGIISTVTAKTCGKTGIEMEALHGVTASLLTIYDMCKAVDRGMCIDSVRLMRKSGGKSGVFVRED